MKSTIKFLQSNTQGKTNLEEKKKKSADSAAVNDIPE